MFGFLCEMMTGQHRELPRRTAPTVAYDRAAGGFVTEDGADLDSEWWGRGEEPGQRARAAALLADQRAPEGQTLADEMRELAQTPPRR